MRPSAVLTLQVPCMQENTPTMAIRQRLEKKEKAEENCEQRRNQDTN